MFFTTTQLQQLIRYGTPPFRGGNHAPVGKLILPGTGCAWLITELRGSGQDQRAYGLADHGTGSVRLGTLSLKRLCDLTEPLGRHRVLSHHAFVAHYPLSVYARAAYLAGHITEDEVILAEAANYSAALERQRAIYDEPLPQDGLVFSLQKSLRLQPSPTF